MTLIKPYRLIQIQDCGEPLIPIPVEQFQVVSPHPYARLGAPYGNKSPFWVRQGVSDRLRLAQTYLQQHHPDWQILLFDAFRPLAVQQFMVNYTFTQLAQQQQLDPTQLTSSQTQELFEQVYEFWALPDPDPTRPPPHSTGGAIDVTLVDQSGQWVEMGGEIDEISPRSYPNYYIDTEDATQQQFHQHRQILYQVMTQAGFKQHPNEWWHFCYGDQMWAWLVREQGGDRSTIARYGRV